MSPLREWDIEGPQNYQFVVNDGLQFAIDLARQWELPWESETQLVLGAGEVLKHELFGHDAFDVGVGPRRVGLEIERDEKTDDISVTGRHLWAAKGPREELLSHLGPTLTDFHPDMNCEPAEAGRQMLRHVGEKLDRLSSQDKALAAGALVRVLSEDGYQRVLNEFSGDPDFVRFLIDARKKA